ncbi:MAG: LysR substrate-binding domain-containing protein [Anderseniella sp.]|nr:LysR substrate-binding domain-containing protein [Anderseniella sp.]
MRFVQLRAFHHVAIHGGFSRAAEALGLTQPAISDQVRKLEAEYDIRLFDRQKKQIRMTQAGRDLLEITNRLFEIEARALEYLSEAQTLRTGKLNIVADSAHHILHLLTLFRRTHPGISVSVRSGNTATVLERLASYEADIGVIGEVPDSREFEVVRLDSSPVIAFVASSSPLARKTSVTLKQVCEQPVVLRESGSHTRALLEEELARRKLSISTSIEAEGREAVQEIVAAGGGVGFVSRAEFGNDDRLVALELQDTELTMHEAIICLRERRHSKVIRSFMAIARGNARPEST